MKQGKARKLLEGNKVDMNICSTIKVRIETFPDGWDKPPVNVREVWISGKYELSETGERIAYHSAPLRELAVGRSLRTSGNHYTRLK